MTVNKQTTYYPYYPYYPYYHDPYYHDPIHEQTYTDGCRTSRTTTPTQTRTIYPFP